MPAQPATDVDAIAADLAALKRDMAALLANLRDKSAGRAGDILERATAQAEAGAKTLAKEVEERPLTALLVAFAVGFVASRLLSR